MSYLYVLAAVLLRLLPHPWNATPLAAMFLFSGATFRGRRESLLVPLAALLISDYAAGQLLWHGRYPWFSASKCIAFLLIALIGWTLRNRMSFAKIAGASLAGSVIFFLITNFAVWLAGSLYPRTAAGLVACYLAGLPFFQNTLLGDLAYAGVMFGSYHCIAQRRWTPARQAAN